MVKRERSGGNEVLGSKVRDIFSGPSGSAAKKREDLDRLTQDMPGSRLVSLLSESLVRTVESTPPELDGRNHAVALKAVFSALQYIDHGTTPAARYVGEVIDADVPQEREINKFLEVIRIYDSLRLLSSVEAAMIDSINHQGALEEQVRTRLRVEYNDEVWGNSFPEYRNTLIRLLITAVNSINIQATSAFDDEDLNGLESGAIDDLIKQLEVQMISRMFGSFDRLKENAWEEFMQARSEVQKSDKPIKPRVSFPEVMGGAI